MEYQDLKPAEKLIKTRVKKTKKMGYRNLSVGSVFRKLRNNTAFSFIGDFPLLGKTVDEIQKGGFEVRRNSLFIVMKKSDELSWLPQRNKIKLVEQLLNTSGED